ncbi:MAG: type II 3-dehydroquinate dehydratase [Clostridiales bacterium]|jgi:3-dehydroquinate dehydratase-2|nr:type II 3-dehydroquinate dehydratase [Clostridiales bacterium]
MNNKRLLVINGANLNLTGTREKEVYGSTSLQEIEAELVRLGKKHDVEVACFQNNIEGEIINALHEARGKFDGVIINAGAWSHYSYAIRDAIVASEIKTIEVHISNIFAREEFRRTSVLSPVCVGSIVGFGAKSYYLALRYFLEGYNV